MPTRSWLARAKSVHQIGGLFYHPTGGKPWDDKQDERAERRWQNAGVRPLPLSENDRPYFSSMMHDSGVLRIERTGSVLRISLNSINAGDFSGYLAAVLDLPHPDTVWPVDLLLYDPTYVRTARVDSRNGGLRFGRWASAEKLEFLYDWFFQQDGRLQWIVNFWDHDERVPRGMEDVYLMVDCASAVAEDRCAEVFARAYGEPAADLYRDAIRRVDDQPIEFNVFDGHRQTMNYIRRRMAARGLTREDFMAAEFNSDAGNITGS